MKHADTAKLRDALVREDLLGKRDARYRANLAFAGRAIRSILLTIAICTSLGWGAPIPARSVVTHVLSDVDICGLARQR